MRVSFGQVITLAFEFRDETDTLDDPTTITLRVRNRNGLTTYDIGDFTDEAGDGAFSIDVTSNVVGLWTWDILSTGAVADSESGYWYVAPLATDITAPIFGPCIDWLDGQDVLDCCSEAAAEVGSLGGEELDQVAHEASKVLYELSAKQFPGYCYHESIRPCHSLVGCSHAWGRYNDRGPLCGCGRLDTVLLPGGPVVQIISVKVDGDTIADDTYKIVNRRHLARVRAPAAPNTPLYWPACQNLDLEDDQDGTFSVTYIAGREPPPLGIRAARELACELWKSCSTDSSDCALPIGATRIERQGVTIDLGEFSSWGRNPRTGAWQTGMAQVDLFLNTYNPNGLRRPPAIYSPDGEQFARRF